MGDVSEIARGVFINSEDELRSGWRIISFLLLFAITWIVISMAAAGVGRLVPQIGRLLTPPSESDRAVAHTLVFFAFDRLVLLAASVIATAVCARLLERRSAASVGYKLHAGWVRDFALGSIIGAATLGTAVAIEAGAGAVRFDARGISVGIFALWFVILFFQFVVAAGAEELLFRGFAFQALAHNLGPVAALVGSSGAFALAHLINPNPTPFSTANTALAGIWLGTAYLMTRSLWLSIALHCFWNLAMGFVFGLPVSGISMFSPMALLDARSGSPAWLSGGLYGPEGGCAATLAMVLSTLILWKGGLFSPSAQMLAAIKHGSAAPERLSISPN